VDNDGVYRTTKSFDGVGAMAKTPLDLLHLVECILTPGAKEELLAGGCEGALDCGWEGLRVGIAESTWGSPNLEKWGSGYVVSAFTLLVPSILIYNRKENMTV
jgi:hypothetical protein